MVAVTGADVEPRVVADMLIVFCVCIFGGAV
jgi:hypothetical protein